MEYKINNSSDRDIPWNDDDITWSTTEAALSLEEEDAIVTVVVVVIGVVIAIIALFCMGIFIDCRETKSDLAKKRHLLRLKMPPVSRRGRNRGIQNEDNNSLASDMCPNGTSDPGPCENVVIV